MTVGTILSATALASSVILGAVNPALACPFAQYKGFSPLNIKQLSSLLGGAAVIAGATAVGITAIRRAEKASPTTDEIGWDDIWKNDIEESSIAISVPSEAVETVKEDELTLVKGF